MNGKRFFQLASSNSHESPEVIEQCLNWFGGNKSDILQADYCGPTPLDYF